MSENPTARFAPSATCYELYENFQIELQELKKQISTKETTEQQGDIDSQQSDPTPIPAGQKKIQDLVLGKIDLVSDIMENMFTKLTNLMNDASKDKDFYSLKQMVDEQNEIIFQLKEEGVQIRAQLGQQKASHKLKKKQLKNQITQQNSDLNEQRQLFTDFKEEMSHMVEQEKNKIRRLEKWFVRLLEKIELDLVEQQNSKLSSVIEKVRNSRKNKPWKQIMGDNISSTLQQNILLTVKAGGNKSNGQKGKKEEQQLFQSAAITSNINDIGVMYSDFDEEDFSQMTSNNNPSTDQKPQSIDKSINQAFIFSDDRNYEPYEKTSEIIPNRLPFTPNESEQQFNVGGQNKQNFLTPFDFQPNNFNLLNLGELASEKVNKFLRQNKLDLSVSQLEQEVLNLFQKTDRSTTNAHLNLKDVQLEDILNVTQQNNSISLELDFNREKMNNTNRQANNINNNSLEKLLNSFSTSLSKKMSQKMKIKELKENFPQELSPISSTQGKSQNNSINLHFSGVEQINGFKNNMMNSSIIHSASNILPLNNNNNTSNFNNSNILNNNISTIQNNTNLMLSFIKGTNKQENRKYNNNTMNNNTDLFILKEIADSESKEDGDKDILQILSASVNNFNTTKNIQEFEKKLMHITAIGATPNQPSIGGQSNSNSNPNQQQVAPISNVTDNNNIQNSNISQIQPKCTYESLQCILQNIKIEDQQENFLDSSQDFSKNEQLDQAIFQSENSINLQKTSNLNNNNISLKFNNNSNNNNNISYSNLLNFSQQGVDETYQQDKKSLDSCSLLADLQLDQKQSNRKNHSTSNVNDSKNIKKNGHHKKSVSQNIPKLDLSGISAQNNNNTTNLQGNNNSNNSFFFTNQISDSPIQTEKNQVTQNLRIHEEQTERKNPRVQQKEVNTQEQKSLIINKSEKANSSKGKAHNKNQLILSESPSSFHSKSDFKDEGNNSFLSENQPFDLQQIKKMQIEDFTEISQSEILLNAKQNNFQGNQQNNEIIAIQSQQITNQSKSNNNDLIENQKGKQNKFLNFQATTSNQALQFYSDDYKTIAAQNDCKKTKQGSEQPQTNQEVKMKQNPSKHGLFIDSFNELFNTNNIHISNESPKLVFDTFNNSLAPNLDDYSNIKQELINYSSIKENDLSQPIEKDFSSNIQIDIKHNLKESRKNLFQTDYQIQEKIVNNNNFKELNISQFPNQHIENNKKDISQKQQQDKTQLQHYHTHLTNQLQQFNKQQIQFQQDQSIIISNSTPKNQHPSAGSSSLGGKQNLLEMPLDGKYESKQMQELLQQKNPQNLFSRKRVISDHDKVKKDFEQVLNENTQKDKNIEVLSSIQNNVNNLKQKINNNINLQNYQQQQQITQTKFINDQKEEQINLVNDQIGMKFNNNGILQAKKIPIKEERHVNNKESYQHYDHFEDYTKIQSNEQRKRATTYDEGIQVFKRECDEVKLKKQIAQFTQKKMVEKEMKSYQLVNQEEKIEYHDQIEDFNIKNPTRINSKNENFMQKGGEILNQYGNKNQEGSPLIQDLKKKKNDLYMPQQQQQYYLPSKQQKVSQIRQQGINKSMEYCSNNIIPINYYHKENLTPSTNTGNYFQSINPQVNRLEQNKITLNKQITTGLQANKIKGTNISMTNPSPQIYPFPNYNQEISHIINSPNDKEQELYRLQNKPEYVQQKQPLFNRTKQQNTLNQNYLDTRINPNNISYDLNNSQDAIKKNLSIIGKDKKKPMRVTQLNQPLIDLSSVNNPQELQSIKFQPLSTPNVPSNKQSNFGKQTKVAILRQGEVKYDQKNQQLRSAISPKNSQNYHNKENVTNLNNLGDRILNDQPYIDMSMNISGISPSQIKSKISSNSPKKRNQQGFNEKLAPAQILSECTYSAQNTILQNKLIIKRQSQQSNNCNVAIGQQQQSNNTAQMKHPTRNRNFSTTNATSLINQSMNYAKIQQNYRTLNNQQVEEFERMMQLEGKLLLPKSMKNNQ